MSDTTSSPGDSGRLRAAIEHTLLRPDATGAAIAKLCAEASGAALFGVCVASRWVAHARATLGAAGGPVLVSVVGFPLGAVSPDVKAFEAARAVRDGADELDMVIDLGALRAGDDACVRRDVAAVVASAGGRAVKAIIETALLTPEEQVRACRAAVEGGAAFVKTSTGFAGGGAKVEDVIRMRDAVDGRAGVKASGGIRSRAFALELLAAGAGRIGTSVGVELVSGDSE